MLQRLFGNLAPLARGLGFAVVAVGLLLAFFYTVVVGWCVWYLAASPSLPWAECGHSYNTQLCWSQADQDR